MRLRAKIGIFLSLIMIGLGIPFVFAYNYYVQSVLIRIFGYKSICGGFFACGPHLYIPLIGLGLLLSGGAILAISFNRTRILTETVIQSRKSDGSRV